MTDERRLVDATRGGSGRDVGDGDAGKVAGEEVAPPLPYRLERIFLEIIDHHLRNSGKTTERDAA